MGQTNLLSTFTSDLIINGSITVPNLLLKVYNKIGLDETELLLILHLWRFKEEEKNDYPCLDELASYMTINNSQIQALLARLIEKKILTVEHLYDHKQKRWVDRFNYTGLFEKLMDQWAILKKEEEENKEKQNLQLSQQAIQEIFKAFENEFGRLLSPFESKQIIEWCKIDGYSMELILEALRKTSLRGIKNLKYINSILLDWRNNNIHTLEQIEEHERRFQARQQTKEGTPKSLKKKSEEFKQKLEKYKDIYMN